MELFFLWIPNLRIKLSNGLEWEIIPYAYHMILSHVLGVHGFFFLLTGQIPWEHVLFQLVLAYISAIGVAAGSHRLWSHRSYKAKLPLRVILMLMHTFSGQKPILSWARDHRLHHKYSETDADPYSVKRGFFFSHTGWTMIKEHPKVTEKEKTIDLSDLRNDPVVAFQHKYFRILDLTLNNMLPVLVTYYFWLPSFYVCVCANYFRFMVSHNVGSMGNSVAHIWTRKHYEKSIGPADVTWLSLIIVGEGWHNFHHVFPWDYRSTDVGLYISNPATVFIDLMAKVGWAYHLNIVSDNVIRKRATRTGDGSYPLALELNREKGEVRKGTPANYSDGNYDHVDGSRIRKDNSQNWRESEAKPSIDKLDVGEIEPAPWGWGDADIVQEDRRDTIITRCYHDKAD